MILNILDMTLIHSGKDVNLVVARYSENLTWIEPYLDYCIIYNKGKDDLKYPYIRIKNVGLEHYCWVYHILNNYDDLPDYLIFFQGSPHYHFIGNVEKFLDRFLDKEKRKNIKVEDLDYIPLTDWYTTEHVDCTKVRESYKELFGIDPPFQKFEYATCGQFCVSSQRIRHYPKSFYEKFLSLFETEEYIKGSKDVPTFAYTAERMWSLLYSQKYLK